MDRHPECALSFHNATILYENGNGQPARTFYPPKPKTISTIKDIFVEKVFRDIFIPSNSVMVRQIGGGDLPEMFSTCEVLDWALTIFYAQSGQIGYLDEVMGVYRVHSHGVWFNANPRRYLPAFIEILDTMIACDHSRHEQTFRTAQSVYSYQLSMEYARQGDLAQAWDCARQALLKQPLNRAIPALFLFQLWLQSAALGFDKMLSSLGKKPSV
jgi:hypothetical protein